MSKIMIVDDEQEIVNIIDVFLRKNGFEILKTLEGDKALDILKAGTKVDLLIIDMRMPKITGMEVLKEIGKAGIKLPVIILSGSIGLQKDIDELIRLGYNENDVMYKPIDLFEILAKVKQKLGNQADK
jgi:two-component system, OmpR family, response regulator VanR